MKEKVMWCKSCKSNQIFLIDTRWKRRNKKCLKCGGHKAEQAREWKGVTCESGR